jgi:hypothetical protein
MELASRVINPETSEKMRYLMRFNVEKGTATRADVARQEGTRGHPEASCQQRT